MVVYQVVFCHYLWLFDSRVVQCHWVRTAVHSYKITCLRQLMSCHVDLPWNSLLVSRQIKNINPSARLLLSDQLSLYSISFDFSAAHWTHHSYGWLTTGYLTFWIQSSQIQGIIIMAIAKKVNVTSLYYYLFSVSLHPKKQILQQLV